MEEEEAVFEFVCIIMLIVNVDVILCMIPVL